jgi:hypothetical protein
MAWRRTSLDWGKPPEALRRASPDWERTSIDCGRTSLDLRRPPMVWRRASPDLRRASLDWGRPSMAWRRATSDWGRPPGGRGRAIFSNFFQKILQNPCILPGHASHLRYGDINMRSNGLNFGFKAEELPPIGGFVLSSLEKRLKNFTDFSHIFGGAFPEQLRKDLERAAALLNLGNEGLRGQKQGTNALYEALDALPALARALRTYIKLSGGKIPEGAREFGISKLLGCIRGRDAEGAIAALQQINGSIAAYEAPLKEAGMSEKAIKDFKAAPARIQALNQVLPECRLPGDNSQLHLC